MKIVATVAEYNPLHTGHLYHIEAARRELSPDTFAVVMSGNFTQRGDVAIVEKHIRAVAAIKAGADIVVELPFIYAVNCAEKFADGAMKTLSCFNNPLTVTFGSECGDIETLKKLSLISHNETAVDRAAIKEKLAKGERLIKARADVIDGGEYFTPNNILGMEYVRAAAEYGFDLHTVKRDCGYNDLSLYERYASANAIRENIFLGNTTKISRFLPDFMLNNLNNCISNETLTDMLLYKISSVENDEIKAINEVSEGLENRIISSSKSSKTYDELISGIKSKRYTMARIKRILLYLLTDVTRAHALDMYSAPAYARVLAIRRGREDLLSALKNPVTKFSDISLLPESSQKLIALENRAEAIYAIASKSPALFNTVFVD